MQPIAEIDQIRYGILDRADVPEMAHVIAEAFSRYDPASVAVAMPYADLVKFVEVFGQRAPGDGLTIIARAQPSNAFVGAMLTDDFADPPPDGVDGASERFPPIGAMLETLDEQYRRAHPVRSGEILHLFMLAVMAEFGARGIAQTLVRIACENGVRKGYRRAVTESTGRVSQQVFRKLGFGERFRVNYREFEFEGRRVFASIDGHEGTLLMERLLT